jgi:hypothetical protein
MIWRKALSRKVISREKKEIAKNTTRKGLGKEERVRIRLDHMKFKTIHTRRNRIAITQEGRAKSTKAARKHVQESSQEDKSSTKSHDQESHQSKPRTIEDKGAEETKIKSDLDNNREEIKHIIKKGENL